jgi:hypothetical protein
MQIKKTAKTIVCENLQNYRKLASYISIFIFTSVCLIGATLTLTNNVVVYAKIANSDFIQVFFPTETGYIEENSVRSTLFGNSITPIKIPFGFKTFDHIRIDPGNESGLVLIEKIELHHLFGIETYQPNDLLKHSKAIQMIDKLEVTSSGFLIHSNGNDPVFELQIQGPSQFTEFFKILIINIVISFALFIALRKLSSVKFGNFPKYALIIAIPLSVSIAIAILFYPGFMSYDSLHALRSARNGVTDSMWPPMVSYVWRAVDWVSINPSAMHFSQIFLLMLSVFFIVLIFTKKITYATVFLLLYLCVPAVLGTIAVIWKDVLMASFFMGSFALMLVIREIKNKWLFNFLCFFSVFLIFLGTCSRHNAITGAVPLLFYLAYIICSRVTKKSLRLYFSIFLLGSILTTGIFISKNVLDHYSFPNFTKLANSSGSFIQSVRAMDIAGASLCVGSNLFDDTAPDLSVDEIRRIYDPRHINLSAKLLDRVNFENGIGIDKIWLRVAMQHPVCFFYNKFQLTRYLVGADNNPQFIITAPSIDVNEYGYKLANSPMRDAVVTYITKGSTSLLLKPWIIYLISFGCLLYMLKIKAMAGAHLTLFLSAVFYFGGLIIFGNAADARLLFYTTTALSIFTFISLIEFKTRFK